MARLATHGCYCLMTVLMVSEIVFGANEEWIQHNARVEKFVCKIPQPRSYTFEDIMLEKSSIEAISGDYKPNAFNKMLETVSDICPKDLLNYFSVYPTESVLHRCQHSGCCKGNKGCLPTSMDDIKLIFAVTSFEVQPTVRYVEVTTTNHTECACQNKKDKPKK